MRRKTGNNRIETVFVLIIFLVFALSVLMVLMLGAGVYRNVTETSRAGSDERTALSYIWTRIKNGDEAGSVYIGEFDGQPALCFDEEFYGTNYRTVIYHYDGWICELFSETAFGFFLEDGLKIIEVGDLTFEQADYGLIRISSGSENVLISPRSGTTRSGNESLSRGGEISG